MEERENKKMRKVEEQRKENEKLDPVGSTVRYEVMKLCTRSIKDSNGWYLVALSQCKAETVNVWYLVSIRLV